MLIALIISIIIMPPALWLILYSKVIDQYKHNDEGQFVMTSTKAEAQRHIRNRTFKSIFFYIYSAYTLTCIFIGACSINLFGLKDWVFSL